jgi:hypothetical protein
METVICEVDFTGVINELTSINTMLITTNEYMYYHLNTLTIIVGLLVGLTAFLVGALLIVMVAVWRRS